MPNQQNFPDRLIDVPNYRPRRVSEQDTELIGKYDEDYEKIEELNVVFGQTNRDHVEVFVYDELNDIVGKETVFADDEALRLIAFHPDQQVGVGQDSTPDVLQINLAEVLLRMELPPGRYSITVNVFRNEIGEGEEGNNRRLFIKDISPSRTELRLLPVERTALINHEINEFIDPSVPHYIAQAYVDVAFGLTENVLETAVTAEEVMDDISQREENIEPELTTKARLERVDLYDGFVAAVLAAFPPMRDAVLNELDKATQRATDAGEDIDIDLYIQSDEMQAFIKKGVTKALKAIEDAGGFDAHIKLVY